MQAITLTTGGNVGEIKLVRGKTLEQLQGAVGGLIEPVTISGKITMWVNEEGKFNGSEVNEIASQMWESIYGKTDLIFGDVIFTGGTSKRGNTLGLSADNLKEVKHIIRFYAE